MSGILKVDQIQLRDGSTPSAADLGLNVSGSVLQVVSSSINTRSVTSNNAYTSTGLEVSVTPKSNNSILKVEVVTNCSSVAGEATIGLVFKRSDGVYSPLGSSGHDNINSPDGATQAFYTGPNGAGSNHMTPVSMVWFDSSYNSTNTVTYALHFASNNATAAVSIGGLGDQTGYNIHSTISVTEIAQ